MKNIMTQKAYYVHLVITCNRKEHFVLRRCSWKKTAKSLSSGPICPCRPKSTDYKPAEHIHDDIKCILIFFFSLAKETSAYLLLGVQDQWLVQSKSPALWVHGNLFRQLSREENLHGSGMSHAMTASSKRPSRHHELWATPWSAEEMLDRQHQRVDIHAYARTAHMGLLQKRLE